MVPFFVVGAAWCMLPVPLGGCSLCSLADNTLCVSVLCKPRAAKGEHAVWGSGWWSGSWPPGVSTGEQSWVVAGRGQDSGAGSLQSKEMFLSLCNYGKRFYRD